MDSWSDEKRAPRLRQLKIWVWCSGNALDFISKVVSSYIPNSTTDPEKPPKLSPKLDRFTCGGLVNPAENVIELKPVGKRGLPQKRKTPVEH